MPKGGNTRSLAAFPGEISDPETGPPGKKFHRQRTKLLLVLMRKNYGPPFLSKHQVIKAPLDPGYRSFNDISYERFGNRRYTLTGIRQCNTKAIFKGIVVKFKARTPVVLRRNNY